jgi:hypothetical protein
MFRYCLGPQASVAVFVWLASQGANASEKKTAESISKILQGKRKLITVDEGKESDDFWEKLGGKGEYTQFVETADGAC